MDENTEFSLGKEVVKALVVSAASVAGTVAGLYATGYVVDKIQEIRNRKAKKEDEE